MSRKKKKRMPRNRPGSSWGSTASRTIASPPAWAIWSFFIIKPTNISVLSNSSISARIYALLNVVKGQAEIEMLALNSKESFEQNKKLLSGAHGQRGTSCHPAASGAGQQAFGSHPGADGVQPGVLYHHPAAKRKGNGCVPYLSRIEQSINDNGFTTRRATEQDLKRMLGVYFEQNVTTEKFEDYDGDRWVIVGE